MSTDYLKEDIVITISLAQANTLLEAMVKQKLNDNLESESFNKSHNERIENKLNDLFN
jgi:hypothetical protein